MALCQPLCFALSLHFQLGVVKKQAKQNGHSNPLPLAPSTPTSADPAAVSRTAPTSTAAAADPAVSPPLASPPSASASASASASLPPLAVFRLSPPSRPPHFPTSTAAAPIHHPAASIHHSCARSAFAPPPSPRKPLAFSNGGLRLTPSPPLVDRDRADRSRMEVCAARAPGKIILAGEHAVVHGSAAVAAAIDLYTCCSLRLMPLADNEAGAAMVELDLKDPGLAFSWPCRRLREVLLTEEAAGAREARPCSPDRLASITRLLEEHEIPEAKIWLSAGLSAFLFLYTSILGCRPGKVTVSSDLPMGSGLGSSAAFCVSMSGVLLTAAGVVTAVGGISGEGMGWELVGKDDLELVNRWAFQGEKIIHGKPSGIDNAVSTFGSMIKFKKGELTNLKSSNPVKMLITDTRVGRNTKALVAGVSERASRHSDAMASVFKAVNSISEEVSSIVELAANDEIAITSKEEKLAELMEMNQGLLQCMGVSHSSIETVLRTTLKFNLVSKLTGAGGGGCVLTLIPTMLSNLVLEKVIAELESHSFRCFKVEVGGQGLQVCQGGFSCFNGDVV
uniref:Mevalonate kinase n=1 Tax=Oryza meridionalis TaxID=40149 RepID=A0A0E0EWN2_9ORYZ